MLIILNKLLWGIASTMIIFVGLYFSFKLKFVQLKIKDMLKFLFRSHSEGKDSISPIESLTMALAARIGVGSLAGIALSIYLGGVGTIFWIWVSAIISASNAFAETVLAVIYRRKDEKNIYRGGPPYYIHYGLGKKKLAKLSALFIGVAYIFGFITIQSNTITKSIIRVVNIYPVFIASIIAIITALIIFKGVKKIADISSKLVPIMGAIYILSSLTIIILNINKMPTILLSIIENAFNTRAFGASLITTIIIGIQRGIFSNEAGLGTGAIAAATTTINKPTQLGLIQVLGIYFTTLIICSMTAFVILCSNYQSLSLQDINGIEITLYAFKYNLGYFGEFIVIITIILFAFSTIITGYYYGESCVKFLLHNVKPQYIFLLRLLTVILLFVGSIMSSTSLWGFVDILVAIIAIINLYSLILLRKDIIYEYDYYKSTSKYDKI
jgi:AGCS family alanine or glycine:cation symporter